MSGTRSGARETALGNRRIDHTVLAKERQKITSDLECSPIDADVFTHEENRLVTTHLFEEGLRDGL